MSKKGKNDRLTGGTNDVNPQWLCSNDLTLNIGQNITEVGIPLPIQRISTPQGKAQIIEVLKVHWQMSGFLPTPIGTASFGIFANLSTKSAGGSLAQAQDAPHHGYCIDNNNIVIYTDQSTNGSAFWQFETPTRHDLTDGAGHGVLVATDQIFVTAFKPVGIATTAPSVVHVRILYRVKDVGLAEYIGIVQSQQ